MSEDVPPYRATRPAIPPQMLLELLQLYERLLPLAAEGAAEALRNAGPEPAGTALKRFRDRAANVNAITDRINAILG